MIPDTPIMTTYILYSVDHNISTNLALSVDRLGSVREKKDSRV